MDDALVYIVDGEVWPQKKAVGVDCDGVLTNLHIPEIYNLLLKTVVRFIDDDGLAKRLKGLDMNDFMVKGRFPMGWHFDNDLGYHVLVDVDGKLIQARCGTNPLTQDNISKLYKGGAIDLSQPQSSDAKQLRFLPYCDGFDLVEGVVKATVVAMGGQPKRSALRHLQKAFRAAHEDPDGFKSYIEKGPERYGIVPNQKLTEFIRSLYDRYFTFLLTASYATYTKRILQALRIEKNFHVKIFSQSKPDYFTKPSNESYLWRELRRHQIHDPSSVFYMGDHLMRDVRGARQAGFLTGLRMTRGHLITFQKKSEKYAGLVYRRDGNIKELARKPTQKQEVKLGHLISEIYRYAHVVTTKVQNLEPVLLY